MKRLTKYRKYLPVFIVFLLGLTPIVWFLGKGGSIINGIDTNFPLNPIVWFNRRFFVWNSVANAGGDFSSSTAGMFFHLIQAIPYKLGFGLQTTQVISLIFWFMMIVFGAFLLARTVFPKKSIVQLLFVVFYAFNIFLFNTWENVKVANLSLVAAIPFALWLLIKLKTNKITYPKASLYSVLIGVLVSGTGINPSYLISFFLVLTIFLLAQVAVDFRKNESMSRIREFLFVSILILLANSFWIFPTSNYVFGNVASSGSIDKIGFTNWIDSLSKHTSLLNILRLQGAWDWYVFDGASPLYIPYALNYFFRLPFVAFSLMVPVLGLVSLLVQSKTRKQYYLAFAIMLVVGVFLGAGTHLPTGVVFRWLLDHVPFFTLFRSPWYIFTPLVFLAYAGLLGLLFYTLNDKFTKNNNIIGRVGIGLIAGILIVGNLFYSYPLVSGKIFRPGRHDSFFVDFPPYIFEVSDWLAGLETDGRVIGYPDDEIENFDWGYRGIESVLSLITDREVLFAPLNLPDAPIARLIKQYYLSLKKGQMEMANSIASKLNISYIFEKRDQESLAPDLPDYIRDLPSKEFADPTMNSDGWYFYKFPEERVIGKIFSASNMLFGYPYVQGEKMLSVLPPSVLLVNPDDDIVKEIPEADKFIGEVVLAQNSQTDDYRAFLTTPSTLENRVLSRDLSSVEFTFELFEEGTYQPTLERYRLEKFGINTFGNLEVEVDGKIVVWRVSRVSDSYVYFAPEYLAKGEHKVLVKLDNNNLFPTGDFENETLFEKDGDGIFEMESNDGKRFLSVLNKSERDISANISIEPFDPMSSYLVEFKYKHLYGTNAIVLVGQSTPSTLIKTQVERLPNHPEWSEFSVYYDPVKTESELSMLLSAPYSSDPLGTRVLYDDLAVYEVFTNDLFFINSEDVVLSTPTVEYTKISSVEYVGEVKDATGPHVIVFSENYSNDWQFRLIDGFGDEQKRPPPHFSSNLYANAWFVENSPETYKFTIKLASQKFFVFGLIVSGLTIVFSVALFVKERNKK